MLIGIDHFRLINDRFGYLFGDVCLVFIARLISKVAKGKTDLVARYSVEEFAILLSNTSLSDARIFAEEICIAIETKPFIFQGPRLKVTTNIDIGCIIPQPGSSANGLIEIADKGFYQAKNLGRNSVCVYSDKRSSNRAIISIVADILE